MTANPTLTWATQGPSTFTIAGANPTVAEVLTKLNAMMSGCTWWQVSDYNSGNGTLEIKRNSTGSPTGELATVRILFFGGSSPNAAALSLLHTAGANSNIYAGLSVDANTTGPGTSYTTGAPYSTKYCRASKICTPSTEITTSLTPKITIFETVDTFGFTIADTTNFASYCGGRMIIRGKDDSLAWGNMPSGGVIAYTLTTTQSQAVASIHPMPAAGTGTDTVKVNYWDVDTGTSRLFGRVMAFVTYGLTTENILGANALASQLIRVPIMERAASAGSSTAYLGELRQLRFGPATVHLNKLKDPSNVLQGTYVSGGTTACPNGMWLGEIP